MQSNKNNEATQSDGNHNNRVCHGTLAINTGMTCFDANRSDTRVQTIVAGPGSTPPYPGERRGCSPCLSRLRMPRRCRPNRSSGAQPRCCKTHLGVTHVLRKLSLPMKVSYPDRKCTNTYNTILEQLFQGYVLHLSRDGWLRHKKMFKF